MSVGRDPACDISLADPHVSQRHGEITVDGGAAVYRDLKSRNGSELRRGHLRIQVDAAIGYLVALMDGDELRLGNALAPVILQVRLAGLAQPPAAVPGVGWPKEQEIAPGETLGATVEPPPHRAGRADGDPREEPGEEPAAERPEQHRVEKFVTGFTRYADIETIQRRVGDDKRALLCLYNLLARVTLERDRASMLETVARLVFESFAAATDVTVYLGPRAAGGSSDPVPAEAQPLEAGEFTPVLAVTRSGDATTPSPLSRTLFERMVARGEALLFEDALKSFPGSESVLIARIRSGLSVPLRDRAGIRGILQVDNRTKAGAFTPADLDLATLVGNHVAIVLSNLEMYEHLVKLNQDLYDALMRVRLLDTAKEHLARFVPEAVRQLVEKSPALPQLDMVDSDATILFLDIGGYTKLTEKLDRDQVSYLVERYFSAFIDEIYQFHGDINETAGDGLMIIFQSDDLAGHARAAVQAALAIRRKTREINLELDGRSPAIDVHMGINTGTVLLGSRRIQGITGARWTYTATGMVTNVCARLAAHAVGGQILVGEETARRAAGVATLAARGPVQFKNVAQPLTVFEVLDPEPATT